MKVRVRMEVCRGGPDRGRWLRLEMFFSGLSPVAGIHI